MLFKFDTNYAITFSLFRHNFTSLSNYFHFGLIIFRRYGIILCGQNDNNNE